MPANLPARDAAPLTYGIDTAAALLDVSERTVWNLIERGKLRTVKIGRRTLVPAGDLKALAEGGAA